MERKIDFNPRQKKVKKGKFTVFVGLCKGCGLCKEICPFLALNFSNKDLGVYLTPAISVDPKKCTLCQICQEICPDSAIKVDK